MATNKHLGFHGPEAPTLPHGFVRTVSRASRSPPGPTCKCSGASRTPYCGRPVSSGEAGAVLTRNWMALPTTRQDTTWRRDGTALMDLSERDRGQQWQGFHFKLGKIPRFTSLLLHSSLKAGKKNLRSFLPGGFLRS